MSMRELLLAGACVLSLAACGGGEPEGEAGSEDGLPEVPDAGEMRQPGMTGQNMADLLSPEEAQARTDEFLAEIAARDNVTETESGLLIETIEQGDGASPESGDYVAMNYAFRKMDGTVIDSSDGGKPLIESLGTFMPGLREGLGQMQAGGSARFVLPPALAFGPQGTPDGMIGPNQAVVFEIDLINVIQQSQIESAYESLSQENAANSAEFLEENAGRDGVMTTDSGLQYEIVEEGGSGVSPAASDTVEVHYRGTLIDGTEFDSSYSRGETTQFPLNAVISGWTEGLQLMEEGDTYRFYIPSELAYGENGAGGAINQDGTIDFTIGPNQALIFDVELIDVKEDAQPAVPQAPGQDQGEGQ